MLQAVHHRNCSFYDNLVGVCFTRAFHFIKKVAGEQVASQISAQLPLSARNGAAPEQNTSIDERRVHILPITERLGEERIVSFLDRLQVLQHLASARMACFGIRRERGSFSLRQKLSGIKGSMFNRQSGLELKVRCIYSLVQSLHRVTSNHWLRSTPPFRPSCVIASYRIIWFHIENSKLFAPAAERSSNKAGGDKRCQHYSHSQSSSGKAAAGQEHLSLWS